VQKKPQSVDEYKQYAEAEDKVKMCPTHRIAQLPSSAKKEIG